MFFFYVLGRFMELMNILRLVLMLFCLIRFMVFVCSVRVVVGSVVLCMLGCWSGLFGLVSVSDLMRCGCWCVMLNVMLLLCEWLIRCMGLRLSVLMNLVSLLMWFC